MSLATTAGTSSLNGSEHIYQKTKKENVFQSSQQELLAFITKCVLIDSNKMTPTMATILDESKYGFVEKIKERIVSELGELLDRQLQQDASRESMIPIIVDKILASKEYLHLVNQISNDASQSALELLKQLPAQMPATNQQQYQASKIHSSNAQDSSNFSTYSTNTLDSCSLGSLASGICPQDNELQGLVDKLNPKQPLSTRLAAAQTLSSFSVGDLLADEFWPYSRDTLQLALLDSDIGISTISTEIYARAFKLAPLYMISAVYISFSEQLMVLLERSNWTTGDVGLNIHDERTHLILKQFRLWNQFMIHLPTTWIRFTETVFKQVMDVTVSLLKCKADSSSTITCIHLLAIVDPQAVWFDKWMMSQVGRVYIISAFESNDFLPIIGKLFLHFSKKYSENSAVTGSVKNVEGLLTRCDIDHMCFLQITSVLKRLIMCKRGRRLFPIFSGSSDSLSVDSFLMAVIRLFSTKLILSNDYPLLQSSVYQVYRLPCFVSLFIRDLVSLEYYCKEFFKEEMILEMINILSKSFTVDSQISSVCLFSLAESFSHIFSSNLGRYFILEHPEISVKLIDQSLKLVKEKPKSRGGRFEDRVQSAFTFLLRQLYRTFEGFNLIKKHNLEIFLAHCIVKGPSTEEEKERNRSLIDNLLNFAVTPQGMLLLEKTGKMKECVFYMHSKKRLRVSRYEKFGYGQLASQISTTQSGMTAICKSGWVSECINDLWTLLECDELFSVPFLDVDGSTLSKTLLDLLKLLATFNGVAACLEYEKEENQNQKGSFYHLVEMLIKVDLNKPSLLVAFEESRQVGLRILKFIYTSSLDSRLLMQGRFDIHESLVEQLQDVLYSNGYILDDNVLLINHILVESQSMGGANERMLPPIINVDQDCQQIMYKDGIVPATVLKPIDAKSIETSKEKRSALDGLKSLKEVETFVYDEDVAFFDISKSVFKILNISIPNYTTDQTKSIELDKYQRMGIDFVVDYAHRLHPFLNKDTIRTDLETVVLYTISMNIVSYAPDRFQGYDWFTSVIFILCECSVQETCQTLYGFSKHPLAGYLWKLKRGSGDDLYSFCHLVEEQINSKLTNVASSFTISGCTPSQIIFKWTSQLFLNVLDWPEIRKYVLSILVSYNVMDIVAVYVSIFQQLSHNIVLATNNKKLLYILNESSTFKSIKIVK